MNKHNEQFSHPPSLGVFFATEMWERYGFYVVQTLLVLYLTTYFKWEDGKVLPLVGSFTAITYLSPVVGGWIADHLLGQKKAILTGAFILFISYICLFLFTADLGLIASLAGIAVGTGLLKPNISSLLGNEYPENSPKRESGFTIFYMGITIGIILGSTLPSQINYYFGWAGAFLSAAFGMVIAFVVFSFGIYRFKLEDYHHVKFSLPNLLKAIILMVALWLVSFCILNFSSFADLTFGLAFLLSAAYLIYTVKHESIQQARQTIVIGLLCVISIVFWAFYFQMFLSWILFISRVVEPDLFGIHFPAPYYVSVQSVGMIIFGYFLSRNHRTAGQTLAQSGIETSNKFLLSIILMTIAYIIITIVSYSNPGNSLLLPMFFIPVYLVISISELLLSPVGLSAITVLSSRQKVSTMMGIFFVSLGIGAFLAGKLANITSVNIEHMSIAELKLHYAHAFSHILGILFIATLLCLLSNKVIKNLLEKH